MFWTIPLLLALAVSIDGFTVGFSCGLRRLVVPLSSLLAISVMSAAAVACSMLVGKGAARFIPPGFISSFGGVLLIIFGLYITGQHFTGDSADPGKRTDSRRDAPEVKPRRLSSLLRRPEEADLDRSGTLSIIEALLLGSALAADAFAAGLGAALIGAPFLLTVFSVGLAKFILLPLGAALGRAAVRGTILPHTSLWGGAILIIIGIINLF